MDVPDSWSKASKRGLALFVHCPFQQRLTAWLLVFAILLAISVADYYSGIELSLALFYLIPISLAAGWLGWRSGVLIALLSTVMRIGGDWYSIWPHAMPGYLFWNICAALIIFLFVVWLIHSLVAAHRGLEGRIAERTSELAESIADRRRLELELLDVSARERAAIGRELHDELGQHLVATALAAQVLTQQLGDDRGGKEAQAIVGWIEQAIAKTRKLARGLLLARIESDRLASELEELAASASQGGVRCRVVHQRQQLTANSGECAQLFRIAQEAIGNALRHSRAKDIELTLATDDHATCLIVADDGVGFDRTEKTDGMGMRIMQHRAQIIGASLTVLSRIGEGTKIICRLPNRPLASAS
jgi:signal transduction histidine kinase